MLFFVVVIAVRSRELLAAKDSKLRRDRGRFGCSGNGQGVSGGSRGCRSVFSDIKDSTLLDRGWAPRFIR